MTGFFVGPSVGNFVGFRVGRRDGRRVGCFVGFGVGRSDGSFVGLDVGFREGCGVLLLNTSDTLICSLAMSTASSCGEEISSGLNSVGRWDDCDDDAS
mmetsp:Transcript_2203/g.3830  ORF Transcript_2203/g.3830 Transcript_2203/m.3830 type:complete len:98 (-) Transcript_2203:364-657(-)